MACAPRAPAAVADRGGGGPRRAANVSPGYVQLPATVPAMLACRRQLPSCAPRGTPGTTGAVPCVPATTVPLSSPKDPKDPKIWKEPVLHGHTMCIVPGGIVAQRPAPEPRKPGASAPRLLNPCARGYGRATGTSRRRRRSRAGVGASKPSETRSRTTTAWRWSRQAWWRPWQRSASTRRLRPRTLSRCSSRPPSRPWRGGAPPSSGSSSRGVPPLCAEPY